MCIICLEYNKDKDLANAIRMYLRAVKEPNNGIDPQHLKELDLSLMEAANKEMRESDPGKFTNQGV